LLSVAEELPAGGALRTVGAESALVEQRGEIVVSPCSAAAERAAAQALVHDDEAAPLVEELDRPHGGATVRRAVAGVHIDVQGPETARAVVRVAVACDLVSTMEAGEAFAGALKAPRQRDTSLRRTERGAPG
jgi:hypothetical protein